MRTAVAACLVAGVVSVAGARPIVIPVLDDRSFIHHSIAKNAALLKLASPGERGIVLFAFPSALGKSGLWGARLPGVLPVIEEPWEVPGTPNLAVDSQMATNRAGLVTYRSAVQFQPESSMVIAGPIRGPMNTGSVRIVPVWSFADVTDPAIDEEGNVYFGARGDDGRSRLYVIRHNSNAVEVFANHWTFLETLLDVVVDSSCGVAGPCTLAVLYERAVGPAVVRYAWAMDLVTDIAPATSGPLPAWVGGLSSVKGEVSVVECVPDTVGSGRVLTVIENYRAVDPPRVTAEAKVHLANLNRLENFCGVRVLPHYAGGECPSPHGPTAGALFLSAQACADGEIVPLRVGLGRALLGSTIAAMSIGPRAIDNEGNIVFGAELADGRSTLFVIPRLRESCFGDSNCDLAVDFRDISTTLANWGAEEPADGFCVPMGDADFDRRVGFSDISATLANWLNNCR